MWAHVNLSQLCAYSPFCICQLAVSKGLVTQKVIPKKKKENLCSDHSDPVLKIHHHHHHHRAHSAAMVAPSHLCSHGSCCYKRKKKQVSNEVVIQFIEISWNIVVKCEENCKTVCRKNKVKLVKVKWTLNPSYPLVKRASAIQLKQDAVYVVQSVPADFAAGVRPRRTSVAFLLFFSFFLWLLTGSGRRPLKTLTRVVL